MGLSRRSHHLLLLLWKNSILKLRQPVFLTAEIIWPVFLFGAVLVPLRLRFLPEYMPDIRYRANALPSAGLLPFMQSIVCDLRKERSNYSSSMPYYPNASLNDAYNWMDDIIWWNGSWSRICPALREVVQPNQCDNVSEAAFVSMIPLDSVRSSILPLADDCGYFNKSQELLNLLALAEIPLLYSSVTDNTFSFYNKTLEKFLCGDLPVDNAPLISIVRRLIFGDRTQQAFKRQQAEEDTQSHVINTTEEPMPGLDRIAPKILYTANPEFMPVASKIMKRANRTIESVEFVKNLAEQTYSCSEFFLQYFPSDSPSVRLLNLLLSNITAIGLPPDVFGLNYSLSTLLKAKQLIDPNNPSNIWEKVALVSNFSFSVLQQINQVDWEIFYPVSSEAEMEELSRNYLLQKERRFSTVFAGVVLGNFTSDDAGNLQSLHIKIRMNSTYVHDTTVQKNLIWVPGPESDDWKQRYLDAGFVFIQDMVERGAMEEIIGHSLLSPGSYLHQMPYPCYKSDFFTQAMIVLLPISMTLAWLFSIGVTVRAIVLEKELHLKEIMRMMGLSDGMLRVSWFLTALVIFTVSVTLTSVIMKYSGILYYVNGIILWLFLMLYALTMISYCFLVSVLFSTANLAACIAALVYFVTVFGQMIVVTKQMYLSTLTIILLSLIAPIGFGIGSNYIIAYELQQKGLQWSNILIPPLQETHFNFLGVCVVLLIDAVFYFGLAWYLEAVFPGKYGVAKPFYFPLQYSYWRSPRDVPAAVQQGPYQSELDGTVVGVSIQHLCKVYRSGCLKWKKKVEAVKDLSVDFYEGQITAILGYNGAGKTTIISLLTGLFEPSSGTAFIYGKSIRHQMDHIRQSLGICPQHNVLFDNLTVREHMLFYGQLKGMTRREAEKQVSIWLRKVNLFSHINECSKRLSGGMQRKLSIMLAFLGDSRTIILDEPTSGVDPHARRQIWDFIGQHRKDHTIILSTHHMDEAEILGDCIAIIANGSLRCCGSFEYLKTKYGHGHHLILVRGLTNGSSKAHDMLSLDRSIVSESQTCSTTQDCLDDPVEVAASELCSQSEHPSDPSSQAELSLSLLSMESNPVPNDDITSLIKTFVPGVRLEEVRGQELRYLLPLNQAQPKVLANMFHCLATEQSALGISSYGLTACSLDEIFVELADEDCQAFNNDHGITTNPNPTVATLNTESDCCCSDLQIGANHCGNSPRVPCNHCQDELHQNGLRGSDEIHQDGKVDDPDDDDAINITERQHLNIAPSHGYAFYLSGPRLWLAQYIALLIKKFHYFRHRPLILVVQTICPLCIIASALMVARILLNVPDQPALQLTPAMFFSGSRDNYAFVGGIQAGSTQAYVESLYRPCGLGTSVLSPSTGNSFCSLLGEQDNCDSYPISEYECPCQTCSGRINVSTPACYNSTRTGTRLQNVTVNVSNDSYAYEYLSSYILWTEKDFIEVRYGGVSFGHQRTDVPALLDQYYTLNSPNLSKPFIATKEGAKAWYSLKGYHAMPTYLNVLNNAILRAHLPKTEDPILYGIKTFSHPFPFTTLQRLNYAVTELGSYIVNPLAVVFAMGFFAAGFVLLIIEERSGKLKHLQLVCGLKTAVYWLALATWDLIEYLLFVTVVLLIFLISDDPNFASQTAFPSFLLLLVSYGAAITSWIYMLSFIFRSPSTAYIVLFCLNFFSALSLLLVDIVIAFLTQDTETSYLLIYAPFPSYCLGRGMLYLSLDTVFKELKATIDMKPVQGPTSGMQPFILSLWVQAAIYTCFLVILEVALKLKCTCLKKHRIPAAFPISTHDETVHQEREKVLGGSNSENILTLQNLSKGYWNFPSKTRLAVNQLCLGMKQGECFGLLGLNGAGKTTTFMMLTGDIQPSYGDAFIASYSVRSSMGKVQQNIGYCPQVDALLHALTGRQHLTLMSRLRGLPVQQQKKVVDWALNKLDLQLVADKPVRMYSGGNKRRLSTAIALLGKPSLILLDEPTSGVDPRARRFLWTIIRDILRQGQSVLLTTHSMAECEALCTRVGIMANGSFRCMGTPQQLKSRYGEGYRIKVRTDGDVQPVKEYLSEALKKSVLKEQHSNILIYQLPLDGLELYDVFNVMEAVKETLGIKDYSVTQTTLDDVFVYFADNKDTEPLSDTTECFVESDDLTVVTYSTNSDSILIT